MKKTLHIVIAFCVIVSFTIFFINTDVNESINLIKRLGSNVALILISTFLAYLFGALGWRYCIDTDKKPSFLRLFALKHVGNVITTFNPSGAVAGELYSADMLIKGGMEKTIAIKSVILSRITLILTQLILLAFVLFWFLYSLSDKLSTTLSYTLYVVLIVFIFVVLFSVRFLLKKKKKNDAELPEKKWQKAIYNFKEMQSSLTEYIYRRPKDALLAFIFFIIQWIFSSLELFIILRFLGYDVTIATGLFLDTIIIVSKSAVPFIPGQIGAEELINKFALLLIGITSGYLWLTVSILRRARQLFWSGIGFLLFIILKKR